MLPISWSEKIEARLAALEEAVARLIEANEAPDDVREQVRQVEELLARPD